MWFERFDIIVLDLSRGRTPSSWAMFQPTYVDIGIFVGTIGFFFVLFLLYARTFPVIAQAEVKTILKSSGEMYKKLRAEHDMNDHIEHVDLDPTAEEPEANVQGKYFTSKEEDEETDQENNKHNPTVNADSIIDTEVKKDQVDDMLERIGTYDPATQKADDLTKLTEVGPNMEQNLHQLGVYTFDQVSRMTVKDYEVLNSIIEAFNDRARTEDWATQAQKLKKH